MGTLAYCAQYDRAGRAALDRGGAAPVGEAWSWSADSASARVNPWPMPGPGGTPLPPVTQPFRPEPPFGPGVSIPPPVPDAPPEGSPPDSGGEPVGGDAGSEPGDAEGDTDIEWCYDGVCVGIETAWHSALYAYPDSDSDSESEEGDVLLSCAVYCALGMPPPAICPRCDSEVPLDPGEADTDGGDSDTEVRVMGVRW